MECGVGGDELSASGADANQHKPNTKIHTPKQRPPATNEHNQTTNQTNPTQPNPTTTNQTKHNRNDDKMPAFMVFHVVNAWEERDEGAGAGGGDPSSSGRVRLFVCAHETITLDLDTR